jgi:low affinity Fe/Cu permease
MPTPTAVEDASTSERKDARAKPQQHERRDQDSSSGDTSEWFHRVACIVAQKLGSHWAFFAALALIVVWAVTGPLFQFNDAWQLVINTSTTIITFLMVFLIQSTQNRDSKAVHLKLDELIRTSQARNVFADLEDATEQELEVFQREFKLLRQRGVSSVEAAVRAHEGARNSRPPK